MTKKAYAARKTVTGTFYVVGEDDKATIANKKNIKSAKPVDVNVMAGRKVEIGTLLPCIERNLVDRGILVEREVITTETLQDIKGPKSVEGSTEVEASDAAEKSKAA